MILNICRRIPFQNTIEHDSEYSSGSLNEPNARDESIHGHDTRNPHEFHLSTYDHDVQNSSEGSISSDAIIIDSQNENKSISSELYKNLLQLIPKISRLELTVERLKNKIKEKDDLINGMKIMHKREMKIRNNFPHLTTVSKLTMGKFVNIKIKNYALFIVGTS